MVKVKYIGDVPADSDFVGRVQPGEIREVRKEVADILITGKFKIVKKGKVSKAAVKKPAEDCVNCPEEKEE